MPLLPVCVEGTWKNESSPGVLARGDTEEKLSDFSEWLQGSQFRQGLNCVQPDHGESDVS